MDEDTAFFCNFVRSLYWVVFEMLCIPHPPHSQRLKILTNRMYIYINNKNG